jgi:hypothetical protein
MPQFVCVLRESRVSGKNAICNRRAEVVRERRRLDVLGAVEVKRRATATSGQWKEYSKVSSLWIRRGYWSCFIKYEMRCQEAETK